MFNALQWNTILGWEKVLKACKIILFKPDVSIYQNDAIMDIDWIKLWDQLITPTIEIDDWHYITYKLWKHFGTSVPFIFKWKRYFWSRELHSMYMKRIFVLSSTLTSTGAYEACKEIEISRGLHIPFHSWRLRSQSGLNFSFPFLSVRVVHFIRLLFIELGNTNIFTIIDH